MAVLTPPELDKFRQLLARDFPNVTWVKADVNDAIQALEDWWETTGRPSAGAEMEAASPGKFTGVQKKALGKFWLSHKFLGGG